MPSFAVISDVHSNLEALYAVLNEIEKEHTSALFFLGDAVGYGAEPNTCVEVINDVSEIIVAGNHDRGAVGLTDISHFNPYARTAIDWTRDVLTDKNRDFLRTAPLTYESDDKDIFLVHGTPKDPERWFYLEGKEDAVKNFRFFGQKFCFVGHSHIPFIAEQSANGKTVLFHTLTEIRKDCRYIINIGSVGQPRDGNPDACYVIMSSNVIEIKRVSYDILLTQKKMKDAGLPDSLITRLAEGR
ncbi:MAG: metallophosphoesterase family protein [Nitrospiraceae bacterium]|nr:MAG: metallophosphoesterase family protein [Nitrospiraceae bacterium]